MFAVGWLVIEPLGLRLEEASNHGRARLLLVLMGFTTKFDRCGLAGIGNLHESWREHAATVGVARKSTTV